MLSVVTGGYDRTKRNLRESEGIKSNTGGIYKGGERLETESTRLFLPIREVWQTVKASKSASMPVPATGGTGYVCSGEPEEV